MEYVHALNTAGKESLGLYTQPLHLGEAAAMDISYPNFRMGQVWSSNQQ